MTDHDHVTDPRDPSKMPPGGLDADGYTVNITHLVLGNVVILVVAALWLGFQQARLARLEDEGADMRHEIAAMNISGTDALKIVKERQDTVLRQIADLNDRITKESEQFLVSQSLQNDKIGLLQQRDAVIEFQLHITSPTQHGEANPNGSEGRQLMEHPG